MDLSESLEQQRNQTSQIQGSEIPHWIRLSTCAKGCILGDYQGRVWNREEEHGYKN